MSELLTGRWAETKEALLEGLQGTKRSVMASTLENTRKYLAESASTGATSAGNVATLNRVILPVIRRVMPTVIANELVGVQPMTGPVGQIHTLRVRYSDSVSGDYGAAAGEEALSPFKIAENYSSSTAAGAEAVAKGEADGALAAAVAAKNFNLEIIAEDVGDRQAAVTRFVTVSRPGKIAAPTGSDRSSLVVFIDADHSGALLEILTEFAVRGVNLTFIQSRPNGVELGQYHFIIDVEGHIEDARVGDTLKALYRICADVRFLGSYARADKVLPTLNKSTEDKAFDTAENWLTRIRSGDIKK
jgi:hypothetical protein